MESDRESEFALIDVEMPAELRVDLDAYAVAHGYRSTDAVVTDAIRRHQ
jgi:hypothetical protein